MYIFYLLLAVFLSSPSVLAEEGKGAGEFKRELLTVEEQVNSLKERVFRSKATLKLLKEIIIQGNVSGSRASIWHVNKLGRSYVIESVSYFIDGKPQQAKSDSSGMLNSLKEFKVVEKSIMANKSHTLSVNLRLRGNGYGIFKYVNKYPFVVKADTTFDAQEGEDCQIRVIIHERSKLSYSFFERPNVKFEPRCRQMSDVN